MFNVKTNNFICNIIVLAIMIENISWALYVLTGFVVSFIGLETAWHFTACRIHDKAIKPCMFKQVETLLLVGHRS